MAEREFSPSVSRDFLLDKEHWMDQQKPRKNKKRFPICLKTGKTIRNLNRFHKIITGRDVAEISDSAVLTMDQCFCLNLPYPAPPGWRNRVRGKVVRIELLERAKMKIRRGAGLEQMPASALRVAMDYNTRDIFLKEIGFATYKDYLASKLWARIRGRVFAKKGTKCVSCGERAVQIHHKRYGKEELLGECLDNLIPVCRTCHDLAETTSNGKRSLVDANWLLDKKPAVIPNVKKKKKTRTLADADGFIDARRIREKDAATRKARLNAHFRELDRLANANSSKAKRDAK